MRKYATSDQIEPVKVEDLGETQEFVYPLTKQKRSTPVLTATGDGVEHAEHAHPFEGR